LFVVLSGSLQSLFDQFDLVFRRRDPVLRLLLEGVEHIDDAREAHGLDGAVGVAVMVVDHLQHARPAEPLERLGPSGLAAGLSLPQRPADTQSDGLGELTQVIAAAPDPPDRFAAWLI
jgi:hypothetical protein